MITGAKILPCIWVFTKISGDTQTDINIESINKFLPTSFLIQDKHSYESVISKLPIKTTFLMDNNGRPKVKNIIFKKPETPVSSLPSANNELVGKWKGFINEEMKKDYFKKIISTVSEDRKICKVFPDSKSLFNAFVLTPFEKINVVIVGQDPYPVEGHANGLAFSSFNKTTPSSLKVIFNEISNDFYDEKDKDMESFSTNDLTEWAIQGVFLLNIALTVKENTPGSHGNIWMPFAKASITEISNNHKNVVFMLWGKAAQSFVSCINKDNGHLILEAPHPAAEIHSKGEIKFTGCKHFTKCNEFLSKNNKSPIVWGTYNI